MWGVLLNEMRLDSQNPFILRMPRGEKEPIVGLPLDSLEHTLHLESDRQDVSNPLSVDSLDRWMPPTDPKSVKAVTSVTRQLIDLLLHHCSTTQFHIAFLPEDYSISPVHYYRIVNVISCWKITWGSCSNLVWFYSRPQVVCYIL